MREVWYPGRWPEQGYDAGLVERCRLAELRARPFVPKTPVVLVEYLPPADAKPLAIAMGLLMHELAVKAAPVAVLVAKANRSPYGHRGPSSRVKVNNLELSTNLSARARG
jgi:hypothetical protein